jgi:hypothetical protein
VPLPSRAKIAAAGSGRRPPRAAVWRAGACIALWWLRHLLPKVSRYGLLAVAHG